MTDADTQPKPRALSKKQRLFIAAYIGEANGNATLAARLAGYQGDESTLSSVGSENVRKPDIKAVIDAHLAEIEAAAVALRKGIHLRSLSQLDALSRLALEAGGRSLTLEDWGRLYDRVKPPDPTNVNVTGQQTTTIRFVGDGAEEL